MPRKDQLRNRQRLLQAAREAFAAHGPDVSIEQIARQAGVGATTFYRHFPSKDDLVDALLDQLADGARQVAARAREIADPWEAFAVVFTEACVLEESDLELFDLLARVSPPSAAKGREVTAEVIAPLVARAHDAGRLRRDVDVADVAALMRMADAAPPQRRGKALQVLLAGLAVEQAE
ncbi:TetR/AcrR family transcriptional regulator [Nonomuraea sp. NN258]|uniref:TetR/AcrR family transcriptional regulator n=1 Tax=Nonomuraea antri TaxID=2730852 RepID=UPI00156A3F15|nr:TetR/AcrR family transcriptional regulator [Nonomuraea antri]NRQ31493.1 TetR/AcrR family transcriptional regulator [Nonomuraea antri]